MSISKVEYFGETLMDISDSTVQPENLESGVVAYNHQGERIVGTRPNIRVMQRTLSSSGWVLGEGEYYRQAVAIDGLTANDKVDFDTDLSTMELLKDDIIPENNAGVLNAVTKTPPDGDIQVQLTIIQVEVIS